jgi:hypothetical protein
MNSAMMNEPRDNKQMLRLPLFITCSMAALFLPAALYMMLLSVNPISDTLDRTVGVLPSWGILQITVIALETLIYAFIRKLNRAAATFYGITALAASAISIGLFWLSLCYMVQPPN